MFFKVSKPLQTFFGLPSEEDSFLWRFSRLAFLNILSNLMVPLAGLMSVAFLGHLGELYPLAGVTLSTILFNYLYRTLGFLRMSTTGITAQAVGRNDEEAVWLALLRNGILALGLGLVILCLQYPLRSLGFTILSATQEVKSSGIAYYDTRIWGVPAALLNFVLIGWFLGREQSGKVLCISVVGNCANVLLDYLLIIRLGWESSGAGLATALSQIITCLLGLLLVIPELPQQKLQSIKEHIFTPAAIAESLSLNRDIFIRTFVFLSTFSLFTNLSSVFGIDILTQNALILQVITLAVYLIDGLAYATETLAGNFKGQQADDKFWPLLRTAARISLGIGLGCALSFMIWREPFFKILTNHQELLQSIRIYVPWLLPVLGFGSIAFMLDGYFLGLAEGVKLRNAALLATIIGFMPMAFFAWYLHSNHLLWLSLSLFMMARVGFLAIHIPKTLASPTGSPTSVTKVVVR